jgi:hypothetical protein
MAQHDYIISNQGFPATRADINNVLNSIATLNSGTSAPATQYAGQMWLDTTTATNWILYIYDGSDNIQLATINTSTNTVNFIDSALDVLTDTTPQLGGNLDVNGNSIVSTSNANITLAPNGTGDVVLSADTVKIGDINANATITTDGTGDLILNTNSGTNSGSITIADGANGAITIAGNGTGQIIVNAGAVGTPTIAPTGDTNTGIYFPSADTIAFTEGGSEAMRINSSGNVQFTGNIALGGTTPTTSGTGISFPAALSASSDANTLDDYEEGSWTPSVGGTATYSAQHGIYVKVGRLVYVRGTCTISSIGSGATNSITGLPFTLSSAPSAGGAFASFGYWENLATSVVALYGAADAGSTTMYFGSKSTAGNSINWTTNVWGNSARIDFNITYFTAS